MEKKTTYGLRLDQMASLFSLGVREPDPADEKGDSARMAALLREQLDSALTKRSLLSDALVLMLDQQGHDTHALAARSLGEVLLSPQSDITLLRGIKECSKRLSESLDSPAERALATTLYFAALASALVHYDTKITQITHAKLEESFALLMEKKWMAEELRVLFSRARRLYQAKRSQP
jgi:hypothetical protein